MIHSVQRVNVRDAPHWMYVSENKEYNEWRRAREVIEKYSNRSIIYYFVWVIDVVTTAYVLKVIGSTPARGKEEEALRPYTHLSWPG